MKYLTYDPNYNYDDDSGGDDAMETEDDDQGLVYFNSWMFDIEFLIVCKILVN